MFSLHLSATAAETIVVAVEANDIYKWHIKSSKSPSIIINFNLQPQKFKMIMSHHFCQSNIVYT